MPSSNKNKAQSAKKPVEELTYEQAFAELEAVVSELEADRSSLDEVMALFERGQELARYCTRLLDQADLKVQQISGDTLADFNPQP
jgi:exodeoxyribonuclease VII small subunit